MLSKYDEEEEDAGFQIRAGAVVADAKGQKEAEVRRKLAEGDVVSLPLPPCNVISSLQSGYLGCHCAAAVGADAKAQKEAEGRRKVAEVSQPTALCEQ